MRTILQPIVVYSQQLNVVGDCFSITSMEKTSRKRGIAARLKELCDDKKLPIHGRQTALSKIFKVSQETARKWLEGESIPTYERQRDICDYFRVHFEWFMTGVGIKSIDAMTYTTDDPQIIHVAKQMAGMGADLKTEIVSRADGIAQLIEKIERQRNHNQ